MTHRLVLLAIICFIFLYFADANSISPRLREKLVRHVNMDYPEISNGFVGEEFGVDQIVPFEYIIHVNKQNLVQELRRRNVHVSSDGLLQTLESQLYNDLQSYRTRDNRVANDLAMKLFEVIPNSGIYKVQVRSQEGRNMGMIGSPREINQVNNEILSLLQGLDYIESVSNEKHLRYTKR